MLGEDNIDALDSAGCSPGNKFGQLEGQITPPSVSGDISGSLACKVLIVTYASLEFSGTVTAQIEDDTEDTDDDATDDDSALTVTSPSGGPSWAGGSTKTITWTSSNAGNSVAIELYKGAQISSTIVSSTANDGSHSWTVPTSLAAGSSYKIKVTDASDSATWDKSSWFAVSQTTTTSALTVTSPSGGPSWAGGSTKTITWTSSNAGNSVAIELYKGAQISSTIVSSTANDGSHSWTVPTSLAAGSSYKIKVTDASDSATWDKSTSFTVTQDTEDEEDIQSDYDAVKDNFDNVTADAESLLAGCDNGGSITFKTNPGGVNRTFRCGDENTNSIANLLMDHYHYSSYTNPINNDSLTWDWGAQNGYLYIKGQPASACLIKFTSTVLNPSTNETETFLKKSI